MAALLMTLALACACLCVRVCVCGPYVSTREGHVTRPPSAPRFLWPLEPLPELDVGGQHITYTSTDCFARVGQILEILVSHHSLPPAASLLLPLQLIYGTVVCL